MMIRRAAEPASKLQEQQAARRRLERAQICPEFPNISSVSNFFSTRKAIGNSSALDTIKIAKGCSLTIMDTDTDETAPVPGNISRQVTWQAQKKPNPIVTHFVEKDYYIDHYENLAKRAEELINEKLEAENKKPEEERLPANVRSRAKAPESLREKLVMRDQTKQYTSATEIRNDVPDLAGVRIILYMPSEAQHDKVDKMLRAIFGQDIDKKVHDGTRSDGPRDSKTYKPIHLGYKAVHYRAPMKKDHTSHSYTFHPDDQVEIQVVSALSHAWAEAGHEVQYKSWAYGKPTDEEERVLDALNGLVQSGDLLLHQFHELVQKRTYKRFTNVHELGLVLRSLDVLKDSKEPQRLIEGHLDVLFEFLHVQDKNYPIAVRNALKKLGYPKEPWLDATFEPPFDADRSMTATICLIREMIPKRSKGEEEQYAPAQLCVVMMRALKLLQDFAGDGEFAHKFLKEHIHPKMTPKQQKGLEFVIASPHRQVFLDEKDRRYQNSQSAHCVTDLWEWFQGQSEDQDSICGLVFRLADMEAAKPVHWKTSLKQLKIGPLSRSSTFESDSDDD